MKNFDRSEYQERIVGLLRESIYEADFVRINNEYCEAVCKDEDSIYDMNELDYVLSDLSPTELIGLGLNGFDTSANWFAKTGWDSDDYESSDDAYDLAQDLEDIAWYCVNHGTCFDDSEIEEVINEMKKAEAEAESSDEDKVKAIVDYLNTASDDVLINVNNNGAGVLKVHCMGNFSFYMKAFTPFELAKLVFDSHKTFNPSDMFYMHDDKNEKGGLLYSADSIDILIDAESIAKRCVGENADFADPNIRKILDGEHDE